MHIENSKISKIKHMYMVYVSHDMVVHIEKVKVLYSNIKYIYYLHNNGGYNLGLLRTTSPILEEIFDENSFNSVYKMFFLSLGEYSKEEAKRKIQCIVDLNNRQTEEVRLQIAKTNLLKAQKEYEKLLGKGENNEEGFKKEFEQDWI